MKVEANVILAGLRLPMRDVLVIAGNILETLKRELVICGGLEVVGTHCSLHPFGYALDISTAHLMPKETLQLASLLEETLSDSYLVHEYPQHIHVEHRPDIES